MIKELIINEKIVATEVRLIGEQGEQLGVMSLDQAKEIADREGLDIALISPNAEPPVCRIMDYGKFKFDQTKKQKEAKKKQKQVELKVIQLSFNIGQHDMDYRAKQARDFFQSGAKVKISLMLKGRQQAYAKRGIDVCNAFFESVEEVAQIEKPAVLEGKYVTMILSPKTGKDKI